MALIGLKQAKKKIFCKVICLIQELPHRGNTNTPMRPLLTLGNNETLLELPVFAFLYQLKCQQQIPFLAPVV